MRGQQPGEVVLFASEQLCDLPLKARSV